MRHMKILHITPHLGGGVGRVLLRYVCFDKDNTHIIATLDYANDGATVLCAENNIALHSKLGNDAGHKKINALIAECDVVLLHFWNHPLLYDFMLNNTMPPCRLAMWSHVSGANPPYVIPRRAASFPDIFVATGYCALSGVSTILSTGGVDEFLNMQKYAHEHFTVGYIGTVDYAKMHPKFIEMSKQINIPDVQFLIVGGDRDSEYAANAPGNFHYIGKVLDTKPYLARCDVFGYPLNSSHYGTGEQVLQEAMAAGVPPVVMNNPAESSIVQDSVTGLVAKSLDEYVQNVQRLHHDASLRRTLGENAKSYAAKHFTLQREADDWNSIYSTLVSLPKRAHEYIHKRERFTPFELFIQSIEGYEKPFVDCINGTAQSLQDILQCPQWCSATKGTPRQYLTFFPNSIELQAINALYAK